MPLIALIATATWRALKINGQGTFQAAVRQVVSAPM
jgi:hypothetical protein